EEGLEVIRRKQHDVYLLDYRLGARTGLELLKESVSAGVKAPLILLTAATDPKVDLEATRFGATDFLLKDRLDSVTLERSIRYALQHFATLRALEKSHERSRLLFERSMDAILISDDSGNFLEVNSAACELLGYKKEELLAKNLKSLIAVPSGNIAKMENQGYGELTFETKDGERRFAEFSACRFAHNLNLCILRDITERRNLEREIQEISEREQRRLGQDLHDGLGQTLTGIGFLTKVLQQKLATKELEEANDASNLVKLMSEALLQTRELARGLCPVVLEMNDLHAALQQLSVNLEKIFGVSATVEFDSGIKIKDNNVAIHLYRIAQEATTNAIKHGKAAKVNISLLKSSGGTTLKISDNGCGLPEAKLKNKGMGLRVMAHRARMIGANLSIDPNKGCGTVVTCVLNKSGAHGPAAPTDKSAKRETPAATAKARKTESRSSKLESIP
ncbi:MAG: hypothetical protein JWM04_1594, partial [Verrucomicrobiales bacterium]|nr:hypothetical protein [Verrucomicrobiales bacterium]